jgi:hypothetical protein
MKIRETMLEPMVSHLLELCKQELEIDELPKIRLISNVPALKSGEKTSFGEFNGHDIKVITTNRHPIDVLRTLAHELVHWKQQLEQHDMDGADGSDTENAANSIAGIIMRRFGEKYPESFVSSMP